MLDVWVALSLLGITFGTMFLVTMFGTRPARSPDAAPDECYICESNSPDDSIGGYPVCEACNAHFFADH